MFDELVEMNVDVNLSDLLADDLESISPKIGYSSTSISSLSSSISSQIPRLVVYVIVRVLSLRLIGEAFRALLNKLLV